MNRSRQMVAGFTGFAVMMLVLIGIFEVFVGLTGIVKDEIYRDPPNYLFDLGSFGWGIIHMGIGFLLMGSGFLIIAGSSWARTVGVFMTILSLVVSFITIPYYSFWSLLILGLGVGVIWALTAHGGDIFGEESSSQAPH